METAAEGTGQRGVAVRWVQPEDRAALLNLSQSIFAADGWSEESLQREFDLDFSHCLIAQGDGVVGYIIFWQVLDEVHILQVATDPTKRRRGIGQQLVQACLEAGQRNGAATFLLEVRQSNDAAIALYRGAGFSDLAIRRQYYSHPTEDALVMIRQG